MIVAGLQKLSLVDYPGKIAAVVFLQGCNFKCGFCQNPDLIGVPGSSGIEEKEVLEYLTRRKEKIDGVVITGGEPTVHRDLEVFVEKISSTGLKVKLDTNGSAPEILRKLIAKGLLHYIALDIKTSFKKYHLISDLWDAGRKALESVQICKEAGPGYELRTTCVPGIVDEDDFREIGQDVKGAAKYCLQRFRPEITHDPSFSALKPFGHDKVKEFAAILSGYVEKVEIRGF